MTKRTKDIFGWTSVGLLLALTYFLWCISEGVYPWR
jgi:hypothetical protein